MEDKQSKNKNTENINNVSDEEIQEVLDNFSEEDIQEAFEEAHKAIPFKYKLLIKINRFWEGFDWAFGLVLIIVFIVYIAIVIFNNLRP